MGLKSALNAKMEAITGYRLLSPHHRGANLYSDLRRHLPATPIRTVLDVGANIGQSAQEYLAAFPQATVHSIEPALATYRSLQQRFAGQRRFVAHHLAFSAQAGAGRLATEGPSETFRLAGVADGSSEPVTLKTLDQFLDELNIEHTDFMKIDTEGHDMEVLLGGERSISAERISIIQVEAGMGPDNDRHIPFEILKSHLEQFGYRIFGIYDQVPEFPTSSSHLRRTNPVFISPKVIAANRSRSRPS